MIKTVNQDVYCCDTCGRILGSVDINTFKRHAKKVVSNKPLSQTGKNYKLFCDINCENIYNNNIKEQINR